MILFFTSSAILQTEIMSTQYSQCESQIKNTEFKWTHSANWLLINSYVDMIDEFRDPRIRKKELWIRIADQFRDVGYEIPFELLDKKFRNLKSTYYQVKERNQQSSNKSIKWEYYKVFDQLLKGDEEAAANYANTSQSVNGQSLTNVRPSAGDSIESRKRKRVIGSRKPTGTVKYVTIESALPADDNNMIESDINDAIIEESQYDDPEAEDYEHENRDNTNHESPRFNKKFNLDRLKAIKLHAETRYFNKKVEYFEKQTMCLDIQRKLMIMQAHKLKLEIDQMTNDSK